MTLKTYNKCGVWNWIAILTLGDDVSSFSMRREGRIKWGLVTRAIGLVILSEAMGLIVRIRDGG